MTKTNLRLQLTHANDLPCAVAWLDGHFAEAGADTAVSADLKVVLDELVANVFDHGARSSDQAIQVSIELELEPGHVMLRFIDNGAPYDPLGHTVDDDFDAIEDRPVGGLGLYLVCKLTDQQHYHRDQERNILEVTRYFSTH